MPLLHLVLWSQQESLFILLFLKTLLEAPPFLGGKKGLGTSSLSLGIRVSWFCLPLPQYRDQLTLKIGPCSVTSSQTLAGMFSGCWRGPNYSCGAPRVAAAGTQRAVPVCGDRQEQYLT